MNSAMMIAFFFGVIVGGLGGMLLIGLFFLNREPVKDIQKIGSRSHGTPPAKLKLGRALQALWGTLR